MVEDSVQAINFLGVVKLNVLPNLLLVDIANYSIEECKKKFWVMQIVGNYFKQDLKMIKDLNYLFTWSGQIQFSTRTRG